MPDPIGTYAETVTADVIEKYQKYVNPTQVALLKIAGFDHIEDSALGTKVTDLDGKRYVDCLGGYGVFSLGHRNPKVVEAVKQQLDRIPLSSKTFLNKPLADLAEKLAEVTPGDLQYTFMCNSGAEAVEAALKFSRMATGRTEIIAFTDSYHGKTMGALSATGREMYRKPFAPLIPDVIHLPWNDLDAATYAISAKTAAVIVEPVLGEGGIKVPNAEYLIGLRALCTKNGALLIADEVQTGLGRTGKMFACDHWDVCPDIMTLAKSLGGGVVPAGAVVATAEIWEKVFRTNPFIHTSTFGGNQLACVAGLAAIEVIQSENLIRQAAETGEYFLEGLKQLQANHPQLVVDVRGLGLMLGVEFADADIAKLFIGALVHEGVIVAYTLNNPNVIRIEPPLIITIEEVNYVLNALGKGALSALELMALLD